MLILRKLNTVRCLACNGRSGKFLINAGHCVLSVTACGFIHKPQC